MTLGDIDLNHPQVGQNSLGFTACLMPPGLKLCVTTCVLEYYFHLESIVPFF